MSSSPIPADCTAKCFIRKMLERTKDMTPVEKSSDKTLAESVSSLGATFPGGANRPVILDDPETVWFVESGALDVFILENREGMVTADLRHMLRAGAGRLLFGMGDSGTHSLGVMGKGLADSVLRSFSLDELLRAAPQDTLLEQVDRWILELTHAVVRNVPTPRFPDAVIGPGEDLDAAPGDIVAGRQGVVWAAIREKPLIFLDTEEPDPEEMRWLPLTPASWLRYFESVRISGVASARLHEDALLFSALAGYHRLLLRAESTNRSLLLVDAANEEIARTDHRSLDVAQARRSLYGALSPVRTTSTRDDDSNLMKALSAIGRHEGITFRAPPEPASGERGKAPSLDAVLLASSIRRRGVNLSTEQRWWSGDSGAMLAYRKNDGGCVALIPGRRGRYRMIDPASGQSETVNAKTAKSLDNTAWFFYRSLSHERPIGPGGILRFAAHGMAGDFFRFILAGFLASLLMLAPAVAVKHLITESIPGGFLSALAGTILALITAAVIGAICQMLQGTALMRIEGRMATRATSAIWNRLLALPPGFLRRFPAGDLMVRVMAFQTLRDQVSGVVANAALSVTFLVPAMCLIFFYDQMLGWVCLGTGVLAVGVAVVCCILQTAPQRRLYRASRELAGDLNSFINGVHKLRLNHAVASAIASWARRYRKQKTAELENSRISHHFVAFSTAIPVLAGGAVMGVVVFRGTESTDIGDFLAVFATLMIFCGAIIQFGRAFEAFASIVPGYEQVEPILEATTETQEVSEFSHEIHGRIRFDHVSFRYSEDSPLVLDDVSIHADPGEFVAIVGESGAGKTTLLQLALGLEAPSAGAVYYDEHDLAYLNRRALRRQIGVVMQDGVLQPGNILENIIGTFSDMTVEDAWRATKLAAVDAEIAAMPMHMFTVTGDNEAIFSGGEAQRIRIAAALAKRPRIVVFDEATNWVDNQRQAKITQSLENLVATRLVIAHRLSTIRRADRIYVLESGRVVQQGTFEELFEAEGLFRRLMLRQTI